MGIPAPDHRVLFSLKIAPLTTLDVIIAYLIQILSDLVVLRLSRKLRSRAI